MTALDRTTMRVAFQGEPGAFSEAAAIQLLGERITTVPRASFDAAFRAIEDHFADALLAPGEGIFDGREQRVSEVILDGAESGIERCTWNSGDAFAKKLDGGGLAEGAGFALECDAHGRAIECGHKHGLSCNKRCKTRRGDCTR